MSTGITTALSRPSLFGWLLRDVLIAISLTGAVLVAHAWYISTGSWLAAAVCAVLPFIACYVLCYVIHEWGHYYGARLAGVRMRLGSYKGPILGLFRIEDYDRRQYLWLSWGGELAHLLVTLIAVSLYLGYGGLALGSLAIGGLAFSLQALAVDQPIIWRVTRGADIRATAAVGTRPELILRRTWQTWIPLAIAITVGQML